MLSFSYRLTRHKRSRSLRIHLREDGDVHVTAPPRVPLAHINAFVHERAGWIEKHLEQFRRKGPLTKVSGGQREYVRHKEAARALVTRSVADLVACGAPAPRRIHIRNQSSRWGSCSTSGTVSINYRILYLPPPLQEYLVAHELCHLEELNHSARFWKLVERFIPDYKQRRKELRAHRIR